MRIGLPGYSYPLAASQQRHFNALVHELLRRGHECVALCTAWDQAPISGLEQRVIRARGLRRSTRQRDFLRQFSAMLRAESFDVVLGFDALPGLNIYFAGNIPLADQIEAQRSGIVRRRARYRHTLAYERAVCAPGGSTQVIVLNDAQKTAFQTRYHTPDEHFVVLPPGVDQNHRRPKNSTRRRAALRETLAIAEGELVLLCVGSDFNLLGLDRAIAALAHMKEAQPMQAARLLVVKQGEGQGTAKPFKRMARVQGLRDSVQFLGDRSDLLDLMLAADVLVHAARSAVDGQILLDAIAAGLPVVTTDLCGTAQHVKAARAGLVLDSPFSPEMLERAVMRNIDGIFRADCREDALAWAEREALWSLYQVAADRVENWVQSRA